MNVSSVPKIGIIGQGYVGLPLTIAFSQVYPVVAYDISKDRIQELRQHVDKNNDVDHLSLDSLSPKVFTDNHEELRDCTVFIVTVPTTVDKFKAPDLSHLLNASETIAQHLKPGDVAIYESTVYPGCTEEECVPVLEQKSGLKYNKDFFVGYSPERIVPGDKQHTFKTIVKVTSGSTPEAAAFVDQLYNSVLENGTYQAPSIKVAEASKAIENAQRDLNISFMNELALIFDRMGIDTQEVLEAASSKWNFLRFYPGLVGGHCIGVDPYYLAHKAETLGYHPQVILSGRRINDNMGRFVASKLVKLMISKNISVLNANILILGVTFKENCSDTRETKIVDIYNELKEYGANVDIYDPWIGGWKTKSKELGVTMIPKIDKLYEACVIAVAHRQFKSLDYSTFLQPLHVLFDLRAVLPKNMVDARL